MYKLFVFIILFIGRASFSQDIQWYQGSVVLADEQVIVGLISVQTDDLILFKNSEGAVVYPAHKIQSVRYYDEAVRINRKFITFSTQVNQPKLYEVIVPGKLTLLRKPKGSLTKGYPLSDAYDFDYFVESENNLTNLQQFRRKLYPYLIAESDLLLQFIKAEKLDAGDSADAIRIVMFYNKLTVSPAFASLQP